jgi:hypothetical protein
MSGSRTSPVTSGSRGSPGLERRSLHGLSGIVTVDRGVFFNNLLTLLTVYVPNALGASSLRIDRKNAAQAWSDRD